MGLMNIFSRRFEFEARLVGSVCALCARGAVEEAPIGARGPRHYPHIIASPQVLTQDPSFGTDNSQTTCTVRRLSNDAKKRVKSTEAYQ